MEGSKQHDFGGRGSSRVVIVVILAIVVVAAVIFIFRSSAENDELTFAAIFPLTGNVSYHKALAEAMQLAVEEVNESGGIQGRRIRLVIADNASKPANAVKEFHRLLKEEHPDVMFCSLSSVSAVLAPLAEENRIPLIALVTSSPNSVKGRKWVYKFYNNPGSGIPILLDVLHEQGVHVLGIINQDDAFGVSYANSLVKIFEKDGGKTVRLQYPTGHIDALPDLSPLMDTDAICIAAFAGALPALYKAVRKAGYKNQLLASISGALPTAWRNKDAEGVFVPAPFYYNERFAPGRSFMEKFQNRYHSEPDHNAATAYDIIYIMKGLLRTGPLDRPGIRQSLENGFSFTGAVGEMNIPPGQHVFDFPLSKTQVNNGNLEFKRWRE